MTGLSFALDVLQERSDSHFMADFLHWQLAGPVLRVDIHALDTHHYQPTKLAWWRVNAKLWKNSVLALCVLRYQMSDCLFAINL